MGWRWRLIWIWIEFLFFFDQVDPTRRLIFFFSTTDAFDGRSFLFFEELYTTYTIHVHNNGGGGVGRRASECAVVVAAGVRR